MTPLITDLLPKAQLIWRNGEYLELQWMFMKKYKVSSHDAAAIFFKEIVNKNVITVTS